MKLRTLSSIKDINPAEWNAIVGKNQLICQHAYLHAIEESRINDCRYFYPVVYDDNNRIIAHTCLYFISTELDAFAQGGLKWLNNHIRTIWPRFMKMRSVECGTPVALGNTFSFHADYQTLDILHMIVEEAEHLARDLHVHTILFRDFFASEWHFFDHLTTYGYTVLHNLPSACLHIKWDTFEAYRQSMRSHYRYKMTKYMKSFYDHGGTMEILSDPSKHIDQLTTLWENVYKQAHEYKREMLCADFFQKISSILNQQTSLLVAKINSEWAGFSLLLHNDATLVQLFCGLDYSLNSDYNVYFNMLYKVAEIGIQQGYQDIDYGITTIIPKLDIGAEVVTLRMYMKDLNPLANRIVPWLFNKMTPCASYKGRHVFKP